METVVLNDNDASGREDTFPPDMLRFLPKIILNILILLSLHLSSHLCKKKSNDHLDKVF